MERMEQLKAMLSLCLIFGMAFCLGSVVGHTVRVRDQAVMARPAQKDWGLSFQEDNKPPVADDNMEQLANEVDVIFTATPQGLCASLVNDEILSKTKIIDLSADFRLKDVNVY